MYTHAFLKRENFPPSFTLCTAFRVDAWTEYMSAKLFVLRDNRGEVWNWANIFAATSYTEFSFQFEDSTRFSGLSKILSYPLQWTRICLSKDSDTSQARLVVDGELLVEKEVRVKKNPDSIELVLGMYGRNREYPGQTTDLNIFSSALPVEQMKSQTSPGNEKCGLAGDFLSWERCVEEEQWTLQ